MKILKLATALPENEFSTEEQIEAFPCELPEAVKENIRNLGVEKRCLIKRQEAEGEMNEKELLELCKEASRKAIEKASLSFRKIDCLVSAYDANPFLSPGLSQLLVPYLNLDPFTKLFNVQGVASIAFPKALEVAGNYLSVHPQANVLICVSGVTSYWFKNQIRGLQNVMEMSRINRITDDEKRNSELRKWVATMQFFLFADGVASAVVTSRNGDVTVQNMVEVTNVGEKDYLAGFSRLSVLDVPFRFGFVSQLAKEIPKLGVKYTGLVLDKLFENDLTHISDVAKWAIHTGSEKILESLAEHNHIEREKLHESCQVLRECGNLAGASLPFILEKILSRRTLKKGDLIAMLGYGWGFSASASILEQE